MANIKAFRAIRQRTDNRSVEMDLQAWLEPGLNYGGDLKPYLSTFTRLLKDGLYLKEESPAVYVYENYGNSGVQRGVWALTNVQDSKNGKIILHEQTLPEHEDKIKTYREYIGLEGDPILLTYYPKPEINKLMERVISAAQPESISYEGTVHQLWKVTEEAEIEAFQQAFSVLEKVYLADGHHRLAAAANLKSQEQQWISSLYISADQLRIREFNRLVIPDSSIRQDELFELTGRYFHISAIPSNIAFQPGQHHRLGMCFKGEWYLLDLRSDQHSLQQETDQVILQEYILKPFFGISDPRTDLRLRNFSPDNGWKKLLQELQKNRDSIAFTLFPMTVGQLIEHADKQKTLPPKSTWIEPKIPYGMLMYCSMQKEPLLG
jgi:uncharacterized protein (DUF1015 family)